MKFKIKHRTPLFKWGITVTGIAAPVIFVIAVLCFGITFPDNPWFFCGLFILWALTEIIFIILRIAEQFLGAKIIVENDFFDIRMVLRRKKIWFNDIDDVKFSHYNEYINVKGHTARRDPLKELFYSIKSPSPATTRYRSRLDITLTSGKTITLNDAAPGYARKHKLARVDFRVNADEDIELYKAYQCYRSVRFPYLNQRNIPY